MPDVLDWHLPTCDQFEEKRLHKQTQSSFTHTKNKNKKNLQAPSKLQISSENYLSLFLQQLNNPTISKEITSAVSILKLI